MICLDKDGGVVATIPVKDEDPHRCDPKKSPCPPGTTPVGDYHTHWDPNRYDKFSPGDIGGYYDEWNRLGDYTGYMGNWKGESYQFDPSTGQASKL